MDKPNDDFNDDGIGTKIGIYGIVIGSIVGLGFITGAILAYWK